jgi:predicted flavoprotein YhiN
LSVKGTKGWKVAQCTSGGVLLEQIDSVTMESKLIEGLYFAGEVTDYDGPCGGYNLQYAWETGIKAGKAMANDL